MSEGRVLIIIDEAADITVEAFASLDFPDVQFWAADDERVKVIDFASGFTASFAMEIREEDREKMLAMFGPPQIPLADCITRLVEQVRCEVGGMDRRRKKGKYKKDWHR